MSKTTALRVGLYLYLAAAYILLRLSTEPWTLLDWLQSTLGWLVAIIATYYIAKGIES